MKLSLEIEYKDETGKLIKEIITPIKIDYGEYERGIGTAGVGWYLIGDIVKRGKVRRVARPMFRHFKILWESE